MDRKTKTYYGGWPGVEHIPYEGDYHVDGKTHLPLEKLAEMVARTQVSRGTNAETRSS